MNNMDYYIGQTKTPLGVIFHYGDDVTRKVESVYYTDIELEIMSNNGSSTYSGPPTFPNIIQ